jgi:hypothetical protein
MSEKWSRLGAKLWDEAQPGPSTLAEVYLNSRGIRLASWPAALRFHPAVHHPKLKQSIPAMIARVFGTAEPRFRSRIFQPTAKVRPRSAKKIGVAPSEPTKAAASF